MAKAPIPGQVKTRMRPPLNHHSAARLAATMLHHTIATACHHWPGRVVLCASPTPHHPAFAPFTARPALTLSTQQHGDLGARLLAALRQGIAESGRAAVMGCDVPHCSGAVLRRAHALLIAGKNPLGPTTDGGFYLLGLQRIEASLFAHIPWSSPATLTALLARAAQIDLPLTALPCLRDIDRYPDLLWLATQDRTYAPFTPDPVTDTTGTVTGTITATSTTGIITGTPTTDATTDPITTTITVDTITLPVTALFAALPIKTSPPSNRVEQEPAPCGRVKTAAGGFGEGSPA